ncbi:MAG: PTS sugar transporter subunit IIC [Bacillota bacterium]|jgi:mannose/fructose/N-acetylgalactosamine-specific phosphotransferase system component IIC|nr:PTS sugar transporter subunit IIC [Bacillota bacterium]
MLNFQQKFLKKYRKGDEKMLYPALITSLIVGLGIIDELTLQWQTTRAIWTGPIVGLLLGDFETGLLIGATIELMFLSNVIVGAAGIPDVTISSGIAVALAIVSDIPTDMAIALAVPVAIFGQFMSTIRFSVLGVPLAHLADKPASEGNIKAVLRTPKFGLFIISLLYIIPTFIAVYFGADLVASLVDKMPVELINAFGVGSRLLAAIGFAMLLSMLKSRKLTPFLIFGYVLAAYFKLNIIGTVLIALVIASLYIVFNKKEVENYD